jgi:hypothetical protein
MWRGTRGPLAAVSLLVARALAAGGSAHAVTPEESCAALAERRFRQPRSACRRTAPSSTTLAATPIEALVNFGYAQLKKTKDVAVFLIGARYGTGPGRVYFAGSSQGGREAVTVAQRFPNDYDGVFSRVPVLNFTSLQLAGNLHGDGDRGRHRRLENGVAPGNLVQSRPGLVPRSRPMCQYPARPQYVAGDPTAASSFVCNRRVTVDVKPATARTASTRGRTEGSPSRSCRICCSTPRRRWTSRR